MSEGSFAVRNMTRQELDWALDLTDAEGWNPGLHDAETFFDEDPGAFFVATADDEPVGCVSAVIYDEGFGFGGLYLVEPSWRGKGVGNLLVEAAMRRFGNRNVGQDAVTGMRAKYESMGFEFAFVSSRYEGTAAGGGSAGFLTSDIDSIDTAALADFDSRCFPARRDRFLTRWVRMPDSSCLISLRDDEISGYGVLRKCRRGYKLGPLFAVDAPTACGLFDSLVERVKGEPVFLDVPSPNRAGTELALSRGMEVVFETHRMYTGVAPDLPLSMIFGITSFEFG